MLRYKAMCFKNLFINKSDKPSLRVLYERKIYSIPSRIKTLVLLVSLMSHIVDTFSLRKSTSHIIMVLRSLLRAIFSQGKGSWCIQRTREIIHFETETD